MSRIKYVTIIFAFVIISKDAFCLHRYLPNHLVSRTDTSDLTRIAKQVYNFTLRDSKFHSKQLLDSAFQLAKENSLAIPPFLYFVNAEYYFSLSDFKATAENLKMAYSTTEDKKDLPMRILINDLNARYCNRIGLFKESIDLYNENLKICDLQFIPGVRPKSYQGLSNVYNAINNQEKSIEYLKLMADASSKENNLAQLELANYALGFKYMNFFIDYRLAHHYLKQSLAISKKLNDTTKINRTRSRIAWNYYLENKKDSALLWFTNLLKDLPSSNYVLRANTYGNIGTIYRDKKDFDNAQLNYNKAIEYAKKAKSLFDLSWVYKDMSEMNSLTNNFKEAYNYLSLHKLYDDSLNQNRFNQGLADARVRYDAESKERELEFMSLKIKNQRLLIYGFASFLILAVIIGILLIRQSKLNAKRRISEMNRKISEITQANLRQQMNPHFIFNTLNSIQYYMYQHDKLATNNYLTKFSSLMRRILENSQHTSIPLKDELDAVKLYLELETIRFKNKFDYEITVDEEIDTILYKVPTMLIQPYVENAICHGLVNKDDKGLLKIAIVLKSSFLSCTIEDNGIGREAALEIKKKKEINHNSLGTKITESRLDLVNLMYGTSLQTNYTDLKDNNGNAVGTRVEIQIPILT